MASFFFYFDLRNNVPMNNSVVWQFRNMFFRFCLILILFALNLAAISLISHSLQSIVGVYYQPNISFFRKKIQTRDQINHKEKSKSGFLMIMSKFPVSKTYKKRNKEKVTDIINKTEDLLSNQVNPSPPITNHLDYNRRLINPLFPMFLSSTPLKTWKTFRFLKFSRVRQEKH